MASQLQSGSLIAVSDPQESVLAQYSGGVKTYLDYRALLADPDVQAVIVTTPTHTHREVVTAAAEAGKAIFCEKPTALTLSETDMMPDAVKVAGVPFQVGFMRRFDRAYVEARRQIDGCDRPAGRSPSVSRDPFRTSLDYANPTVSGGLITIWAFTISTWALADRR